VPSSSADLSICIASHASPRALELCLAALAPQLTGAEEVVVYERKPAPAELRERFAWAHFHPGSGRLVPELWRDAIARSCGELVLLTIATMEPAPDWVATARVELARGDVVAGAIEPGRDLRVADWAEYFVRYSRDLLPFSERESALIPGDNAGYRRSALERTREAWADGFWEPLVNGRLAAEGVPLRQVPGLVVAHGRGEGARAFLRQRFAHGRVFGRQRGAAMGAARKLAGVVAAPFVALLLTARIAATVRRKGRFGGELVRALPLVVLFNAAWALGEAVGQAEALRA